MVDRYAADEFDDPEDERGKYDDYEFGAGVADGKNMEAIDNDVSAGPPVGDRTLDILSIKFSLTDEDGEPKEKMVKCFKDGTAYDYCALNFEVEFGWSEDHSKTIRDFFMLPPGLGLDPARQNEVDLYLTATKEDVKPNKNNTGFHWRKLKHFLGHAGLPILADGQIAKFSGKTLRFWPDGQRRQVVATIDPPKDGGKYKSIRMFNYKDAESTVTRKNTAYSSGTNGGPAKQKTTKGQSVQEAVQDVEI